MSQAQLDLVATMEGQIAATSATLAELKATLSAEPGPEPPEPSGDVITTPAALDAALDAAAPGAVLTLSCTLVYPGQLTIGKSVTLQAETLDGARQTRDAPLPVVLDGLVVPAADVTIRGLDVRRTNHLTDIAIVSGANVTLDRCRILGDPVEGAKRGIAANAINVVIVRCYIDDCFQSYPGSDSQAIIAWDTPGPILIDDNFLSAGSETIMLGGADPSCDANVPADVTIRGNTITANPAWRDLAIGVKSRLELKLGRRVVVEDNEISYCWGGKGQDGYLLSLTVRNQSGSAPYSTIEQITIRNNWFHDGAAAINILAEDDNHPSGRLCDVEITGNEFTAIDHVQYAGSPKLMLVGRGPLRTTIGGNTFAGGTHTSTIYFHGPEPKCESFDVVDNTWPASKYGIFGSDTPSGSTAWEYYVASGTCEGNEVTDAAG